MTRFERAMGVLAAHEGGYSNHPSDPGGATMKGVTKRVYDAYRKGKGEAARDVRKITDAEVYEIYRRQYWDAVRGDELPSGVAYCVFDAAVNSGVSQAAKWLQRAVGVADDGAIGSITLAASERFAAADVIDGICDRRLAFMKRLKQWSAFKNGWTRRVSEVRAQSKAWANGATPPVSAVPAQPRAEGAETKAATTKDMMRDPSAITAVGGAVGSVAAIASGDGPVQYALAVALVVAVLVGVWMLVRSKR